MLSHNDVFNMLSDNKNKDEEICQQIKKLLEDEVGELVKKKDSYGSTALHFTAFNNFPECAKLLLFYGAKNDVTRSDGEKPIHVAVMSGAVDVVKVLVENDRNQLRITSDKGRTAFYRAAMEGQIKVLNALLELGDEVNQINFYDKSKTALHVAVEKNNVELARFLVGYSADVNKKDSGGCTPLQRCAEKPERLEIAKVIVEHAGKKNIKLDIEGVMDEMEDDTTELYQYLSECLEKQGSKLSPTK